MATTWNISNEAQLTAALAGSADGDTLFFAPGDYTGVLIDVGTNKDLTFTSANAGFEFGDWPTGEVILNRISSNGSVTVDGIHVHETERAATFIDGGWEAIAIGNADESITVRYSKVTIDATSDPTPGQAFGVIATYNTNATTVSHTVFGPYEGDFDPTFANYGVYVNGSTSPSDTISITDNVFELGTTRNVGVKLAHQIGGSQVDISGNTFEDPGTARGAIRIDDEGYDFGSDQDFSGITENAFTSGVQISNETQNPIVDNGYASITGTNADETFVADSGFDDIDGGGQGAIGDTIDMTNAGAGGSTVDLKAGTAFSTATGIDSISNIENAKGSSGNDALYGSDGDNTFYATTGHDLINGRGEGANGDTFDASAAATAITVNLNGGATSGAFTSTLTDIENAKTGAGNDTVILSGEVNHVDGGANFDTAVSTANYADVAISWDDALGQFNAGSDTLKSVEKLDLADKDVWLVHNSAELTYALANATTGDVLKLAKGTYAGSFNVTVDGLTIESASGNAADVVLKGTFKSDNGIGAGTDIPTFLKTAAGYSGGAPGLSIQADNITIHAITITEHRKAIDLQSNTGLTLDGVTLDNNVHSIYKETGTAEVSDFVLKNSTISRAYQGLTVNADADPAGGYTGSFDGVDIFDTTFSHLLEKGIYAEQLSDANIHDITMNDVGQFGRTQSFGPAGQNGAGIDINLKYGDFEDISITDFHFTDVGLSNGAGSSHFNGGAIHVKARDDGGYASRPATLDNVTIKDGDITNTSTGIRVGEPGKTTVGASDVTIENVKIVNATAGSYDNETTTPRTIVLTDDADVATANPASTGSFIFEGGTGNDSITGGNGLDVAVFNSSYFSGAVSGNASAFTVNGGADGTDTLASIEKAVFTQGTPSTGDDKTVWLVNTSAELTAALSGAADNDIIQLAAGVTYDGVFTIANKALTILGADAGGGVGNVPDGTQSVIHGRFAITGSKNVTIDGVQFLADGTSGIIGPSAAAIDLQGSGNHQILNSLFYSTFNGAANGVDTRGIMMGSAYSGHATISGNTFNASAGSHTALTTANAWGRGIWSDGNFSQLDVLNNHFAWLRTGLNLDGYNDTKVNISGNVFDTTTGGNTNTVGTAVSIGTPTTTTYDGVHDNDLSGAGSDFNFRNILTPVTFDYGDTGNTSNTVDGTQAYVEILGTQTQGDHLTGSDGFDIIAGDGTLPWESNYATLGSGNDTIDGQGGNDWLVGQGGNDSILGGTGNDTIEGNAGDDVLKGEANNDSISGGDGTDTITGGTGNDTLDGGAGTDEAVYSGTLTTSNITYSGGKWSVTGGADGTDSLAGVERVTDANGHVYLLVGADGTDGYVSIQAAIDAATGGEIILVAPGTYVGDLTINKDVTILGANAGTSAGGTRGAESVIEGGVFVAGTGAGATLNGFSVTRSHSNPALENASIFIQADGVEILNNIVVADVNALTGVVTSIGNGGATISGNSFDGFANFGAYINPNGLADASTITNNWFTNILQAVVFEAGPSVINVSGNVFSGSITLDIRAAIRSSTDTDVSGIIGTNTYSGGAALQVRIDSSGDTEITGSNANDLIQAATAVGAYAAIGSPVEFHGGAGNDTLKGGAGGDTLDGGADNDSIDGGAGNDSLVGGGGADTLLGGANDDTITGGADNDSIDGGSGTDTVIFSGNINDYAVQYDSGTQTYAVTHLGTSEIDSVKGVEKFSFNGSVVDVSGNPNLITNTFLPVFSSGTAASFDENAVNPTVYTAVATDADSAAVFGDIVYSLEGPDAGLFTINSSTGVVKLTGSANFEADPSYSITVRATQGITSQTRSVTLSVNDLNDNVPVFQSGNTANVNENAAGVTVYDANATDADASFGNIVYSLEGADAAAFSIDASTGVVTLTGAANFEVTPSYAITVKATQGTTSTTKAVTVTVNDLNDNAPVFQSGTTASVNENTAASVVVYDANATDADSAATFGAITYSLSGTDASAFTIDAATGQVRLNSASNFETKAGYAFAVTATQGSTATTQNVALAVNDLNDNSPAFQSGTTASVNENTAASVVVYDANATDADSAATFGAITYSLSGTDASAFTINATTGEVRLNSAANFETKAGYAFAVTATQGSTATTQNVALAVNNLNDNSPVFQSGTTASVDENTAASAVVYDANATDADSSATFGAIVYSLSGADASAFTIDASTGQVKLKAAANFEAKAGYAFAVTATQGSTATTQNVALAVTDVDEGIVKLVETTVSVESGSTKTPLGSVGTAADGTAFEVKVLDAGGGTVLNGTTLLAIGQTLTLAQLNALTFSSGASSGNIQLQAQSGLDTTTVTVNLNVTAAVNATYTGTSGANRIDGAGGNDAILGNGGADILIGGAGKDTISGGNGKDTIYGGAGKDVLTGGAKADQFVFDTTVKSSKADTITDFKHGTDKIALDDAIFTAIGTSLTAKEFYASATGLAHDGSDRIVYETDTGKLYYDADGNGAGKAILFATLTNHATLTLGDFLIV